METKADQIKRLQGNDTCYYALSVSDKKVLASAFESAMLLYRHNGGWSLMVGAGFLSDSTTYRIHRSYKPEPDTPVFPGYELCKVEPDEDGLLSFNHGKGKEYEAFLSSAPNLGCCGYVFEEDLTTISTSPIKWKADNVVIGSTTAIGIQNGNKPATLGWVCFKEEVK